MTKSNLTNSQNILFLILSLLLFGVFGYYFQTGMHPIFMTIGGAIVGLLSFVIFKKIISFLSPFITRIPSSLGYSTLAFLATTFLVRYLGFRFPESLFYLACIIAILSVILFHYSWSAFKKHGFSISSLGVLAPILFLTFSAYWLLDSGHDPYPKNYDEVHPSSKIKSLSSLGFSNPSINGAFEFTTFTYGSNNDKHRDEYNEGVAYKTKSVDASLILPEWKGKKKKWRERYWGFGVKEFPINGRVHMPTGSGPFPITLIVHGNHSMIDYSDDGYNYLTKHLASKGIIGVSVDQNFINGHWSGDFMGKEMPTRAWLLLKHLQQWKSWNNDPTHALYQKINLNQVILMGHSRGGEAVSIAAMFNELPTYPDNALMSFDFNFGIKGVISIAPTDYRYHRQTRLKNLNYLSLQGSYDADEVSFWGMRPYHRLAFTDDQDYFKAGVYIHRANHGQFNTTWGSRDFGPPTGWLLNTKPMCTPKEQQDAAKLFISAFAEATVLNNNSYLPIFEHVAMAKDWLPKIEYLTHFRDSDDLIILNYEDDINVYTGKNNISITAEKLKIWREENLTTRDKGSQENNVVVLGWDYGNEIIKDSIATYSIHIPDATFTTTDTVQHLILDIAAADVEALNALYKSEHKPDKRTSPNLDFQIAITDTDDITYTTTISTNKRISAPLKTRFTKLKSLDKEMIGDDWEIQLETFKIPLSPHSNSSLKLDYSSVKEIKFIFNQCPYGIIAIDNIGFSKN